MTNRQLISKLSLLASIGIGSFYTGSYVERCKLLKNIKNEIDTNPNYLAFKDELTKSIAVKPGLPIFGTVSAAVPTTANSLEPIKDPKRISQIMKYGFPGLDNVRSFDNYVLSYDRRNRVAHWVFEHLTTDHVKHNDAVDRSKCEFKPDESIHPFFRAQNTDFKKSGFDRGHMAAAGNHKFHQKHVEQTFYLSNMAPQVGKGFNRDSWNRLERHVRKLTKEYPNVYCCTGPLYLPKTEADGRKYVKYQVIGDNSVAVPTHFYKIVVMETSANKLEMEAYVMPNQVIDDGTPLKVFQVPPESIERASGLLFFDRLARNKIAKINGKSV